MDDFDPDSLLLEEARQRIIDSVEPLSGSERIPVSTALARVSTRDVLARIDVPPFACSAMAGYACRHEDATEPLQVIGKSLAGHPYPGELGPGQAVRITTGAAIPRGADTVVMQEYADLEGDTLTFTQACKVGQFIRAAGSDTQADALLLEAGTRLNPPLMGLLASQGISEVDVYRTPRVAVISTGDELRESSAGLAHGQIHDSNRTLIFGLLQEAGWMVYDGGIVGDNPEELTLAFDRACEHADVIITSGGVSVGEADFVRTILEQYGDVHFWKIAVKPGRPLTVARYRSTPFFGLPGNPVSVAATLTQLVRPAIEKMSGLRPQPRPVLRATALGPFRKQAGRMEFQRGKLSCNSGGEWVVESAGAQDSHVLSALGKANCYVILPLESAGVEQGETVDVQPLSFRL